jgi:hemolysin activation/secretion protein
VTTPDGLGDPQVDVKGLRSLFLGMAAGTAASWTCCISAQQVPPGATAGAVLPHPEQTLPPIAPAPELFSIPKVSERPLGLEEGPRLRVKSLELKGVIERPSYGVHVADIRKILESQLTRQPVQGYSINQLQELAGKVADYYHAKGFILAQAFIPAQDVQNGAVTVQVLEGTLSAITTEGNKSYSAGELLWPFKNLLGGPVEKDTIESALLTLANYPGLTAFGVLGAGRDVGTTNLLLRVQNEKRVNLESSIDNHGSQFAGQYRSQLALGVNNVLGEADRLRLFGLYGFDPSDGNAHGAYGGFTYAIPVFTPRDSLQVSYSTNSYDIGKVTADIAATRPRGSSGIAELEFRHVLPPSRLGSASFGLALDSKRATFQQLDADRFHDNLTTAALDFAWNRIDTRFRGVNQLEIAYTQGFKNVLGAIGEYHAAAPTPPSRAGASGQFGKLTLNIQRLQRITLNSSILLRIQGQQSSHTLLSLEQLSLGGPDAVRAYPVAEVLMDRGAVATAEIILGAPGFANRPAFAGRTWGQVLEVSLFTDYGTGHLNGALPAGTPATTTLGGYGGALQFNIPGRVFARFDLATPATGRTPSNGRDPQYFFRLGTSF